MDRDVAAFGVLVEDFDQDGDLDILFGTSFLRTSKRYQFLFYINDGKGHFKDEGNVRFPLDPICPDTFSIAKGDFDGDGDVDFVVGNYRFFKNGLLFYENMAKGFFLDTTVRKKRLPRTRPEISQIVPADLDLDGDLDLVVTRFASAGQSIFWNNGKGYFHETKLALITSPPILWTYRSVAVGDVNGDRYPDLFFVNESGASSINPPGLNATSLWINDHKGKFKEVTKSNLPVFNITKQRIGGMFVRLKDLDLDGDLDAFLSFAKLYRPTVKNRGFFFILENNGNGVFKDVPKTYYPSSFPEDAVDCVLYDIDNDQDPDIVFPGGDVPLQTLKIRARILFNTYRHLYAPAPPQLGKPYELRLMGPSNQFALLYSSFGSGRIDMGFLGVLRLDPAKGIYPLGLISFDSKGNGKAIVPMPPLKDTQLKGKALFFQALIIQSKYPGTAFSNAVIDLIKK